MRIEIGQIEALYRYPVKSMRGLPVERASLGWHGLEGDRRFAFRRRQDLRDFPWVTAGKVPRLVLYTPREDEHGTLAGVLTPEGVEMPIFDERLATEVERACQTPVEMMQLKHGIFDDACVSIIASDTVREIGRLAGNPSDVRRFRPNVVIRCVSGNPFQEEGWLGGSLTFGEADHAPSVSVTMRDLRCAMINIDPDAGTSSPEMLKAVVRANQNVAGVYATVTRTGSLAVGQPVILHR
jgi:uncharacterized protein YcbX